MSGTSEGRKKAAETTKERHGKGFHQNIGKEGGSSQQGSQGGRSAAANKSSDNRKTNKTSEE